MSIILKSVFLSLAHFVKSCNNSCNFYPIEIILASLESWDNEDKFQYNLVEENWKEKWKKRRRKLAISWNIFFHILKNIPFDSPIFAALKNIYGCIYFNPTFPLILPFSLVDDVFLKLCVLAKLRVSRQSHDKW